MPGSSGGGGDPAAVPDWLSDLVGPKAGMPSSEVMGFGGVVNLADGEWLCARCKWRNFKPRSKNIMPTCVQCHAPKPLEMGVMPGKLPTPAGVPGLPGLEAPKAPPSALVAANMLGMSTTLNQLFTAKAGASLGSSMSLLDTNVAKGKMPGLAPPGSLGPKAGLQGMMNPMNMMMGKSPMMPQAAAQGAWGGGAKGKMGKGLGKGLALPKPPGLLVPRTLGPDGSPPAVVSKAPFQAGAPTIMAPTWAKAPGADAGGAPPGADAGGAAGAGGGSSAEEKNDGEPESIEKTIEKQQAEIERLRASLSGNLLPRAVRPKMPPGVGGDPPTSTTFP